MVFFLCIPTLLLLVLLFIFIIIVLVQILPANLSDVIPNASLEAIDLIMVCVDTM